MSRFLMPALVVLTVALSIFVVTRPGAKAGVEYYLKPDFSKLSVMTFIAALGQMFYSMSLAMGIMVTYGSYFNKDESIVKSTRQIEIFDTAVAFLAGLMIVPSVLFIRAETKQLSAKVQALCLIPCPRFSPAWKSATSSAQLSSFWCFCSAHKLCFRYGSNCCRHYR